MHISLASSRSIGFKKWSDDHPPDNDDDDPTGAPVALAVPPVDDPETAPDEPHRPWLVPGMATAL
jgi:hypothetical protein